MLIIRPGAERGVTATDWLDSRHSFSFGYYRDPRHVHFRALRVLNDDRVKPASGFPMHSHQHMEILTWILEGELQHRDSLGNGSAIRPGEIQRMSAGIGISHSEFNASPDAPVHLLQIWLTPEREGLPPGYEQRATDIANRSNAFVLLAAPEKRGAAVHIALDCRVWAARLTADGEARYELPAGRYAWLQVARGAISLNGRPLAAGDGCGCLQERALDITAREDAEVLLFDLA